MDQTAPHVSGAADTGNPAEQGGAQASVGRRRLSLRGKGIIAFVGLTLYAMLVATVVADSRLRLFHMVQDLELVHRRVESLVQVNMAVARAILTVNDNYFQTNPAASVQPISLEVDAVLSNLSGLKAEFGTLERNIAGIEAAFSHLRDTPSRGDLALLRNEMHDLVGALDAITRQAREREHRLSAGFRVAYDAITMEAVILGLLGVVVIGAVTALFFSRLTWDLRKLQQRAIDIVHGYRGAPLDVTRGDEVGGLMEAVNRMQQELREREGQLELSRQQHFHKEKMAAVGSLAAALAHEINNPIAAIAGVAQSLCDNRSEGECVGREVLCQPELILEQARRVASITRQISDFTAPQSAEPQLLDLNALVRSTCNFVSYDRRFSRVDLKTDLDGQLPAVNAVGDHITQILMNLLINAADALEDVSGRKPAITVRTEHRGGRVVFSVADNGKGMSPETLQRAFEEFYTTKPGGRGSGLGLALCRGLVAKSGGEIRLDSRLNEGTVAVVELPIEIEAPQPA
jgi:signal transduction histidine kinase